MIKQRFNLDKYSWRVYVYYDATNKDLNDVIDNIHKINLPSSYIKSAYTILKKESINCGLTLTNATNQSSIIVITKTSNAGEFVNSFFHEIYHLVNHIAKTYKIDYDSEELCYLTGHISQTMFKKCHHLMCDYCKNE